MRVNSILVWTVLALNAVVLLESFAIGWVAQNAAGRVVEERVAKEMVRGVSGFLAERTIPINDTLLSYLRRMLNADWVAVDGDATHVTASTLDESALAEFQREILRTSGPGEIRIGGSDFRVDSSPLTASPTRPEPTVDKRRLYLLIPRQTFQESRNTASTQISRTLLPITALTTLLALVLAFATARPISNLTREINRLSKLEQSRAATNIVSSSAPADTRTDRKHTLTHNGPAETRQLAGSFYELMDRLAATQRGLAASERLATLGKVSLSVAHELRNPLSGIKMNMRILADTITPADAPIVTAMSREIDRMALYLDELMSFAPGGSTNHRESSTAAARLSDLSESVLTILSGRCRHAHVTVERIYPRDEPEIRADTNQIRQVMMNFIGNAIEAMPAGGTLTVSIHASADKLRYAIRDTGPGVTATGVDIFEAFTTTKPNGVGLGLYLSKQIVTHHGGQIGWQNAPGGAEFWFDLSIAADIATQPRIPQNELSKKAT